MVMMMIRDGNFDDRDDDNNGHGADRVVDGVDDDYNVKNKRSKQSLEMTLTLVSIFFQQLNDLKSENSRLKEENGALIRVISKLSKPPT